MAREVMLTTTDNPFDPFTQFIDWYRYDTDKGYNTCGYMARLVALSDDLSDFDNDNQIELVMDEIVALNLTGNYKKLVRYTEET